MALTTDGYNIAAAALAGAIAEVSLHSDTPGAEGANEIEGGDYQRLAVSWSTPLAGSIGVTEAAAGTLIFNVPEGAIVAHVGLWSDDGVFLGAAAVPERSYVEAGEYRVSALTALVHACP